MYNVKPFKYTRELDYILGKIIDRKKTLKGQWDWVYDALERPNNFHINLKNDTIRKFNLQDWEYVNICNKLIEDEMINSSFNPLLKGVALNNYGGYRVKLISKIITVIFKFCASFGIVFGTLGALYISNKQYNLEERKITKEEIELKMKKELIRQKEKIDSLLNLTRVTSHIK